MRHLICAAALALALTPAAANAARRTRVHAPPPGPTLTYLGEVRAFAFNFCPQGWAAADGSTLPISQYQQLFSLLGTAYGGNGVTTFALPNLQGLAPVGQGAGGAIGQTGNAQPGAQQRFLVMNWCINLNGTFPSH